MARQDVVLVTGASIGVGLEIAQLLLDDPSKRLVLTARASSLDRFAAAGLESTDRIWLRALDVTDEAARGRVIEEVERRWGGVDVLVNNAGISYRSVVEQVTEQERLAQMAVNFRAPMALIAAVLPSMRAKRRGRILNISSVGGMMAMPTMAIYSASKFALEGATEALWYEVRPWNIHVTLVEPGFINSDGFQKVRFTEAGRLALERGDDPYSGHYRHMEGFVSRLMRRSPATPATVARRVVRLMHARRPPLRAAGTPDAWVFSMLRRLLPQRLYHSALYLGLPGVRRWGEPLPALESTAELTESQSR